MPVAFYMDVHVPVAITEQLRRRGVDVLTTIEDDRSTASDPQVLERARTLRRVVFTQDIGFRLLAESWQRDGRSFSGLIFGHQTRATIGQYVKDLELVARASTPDEWENTVETLPF